MSTLTTILKSPYTAVKAVFTSIVSVAKRMTGAGQTDIEKILAPFTKATAQLGSVELRAKTIEMNLRRQAAMLIGQAEQWSQQGVQANAAAQKLNSLMGK